LNKSFASESTQTLRVGCRLNKNLASESTQISQGRRRLNENLASEPTQVSQVGRRLIENLAFEPVQVSRLILEEPILDPNDGPSSSCVEVCQVGLRPNVRLASGRVKV
jgi:hypothetical protein